MKIAIIGMASGWDTPKKKDYDELWAVSPVLTRRDDVDLVFQIHNLDWSADGNKYLKLKGDRENFREEIKIINDKKIPVMIQAKHKLYPHGVVFPLDEMPVRYFTSTFAYMLAYAIHKRVDEIGIYGVALSLKEEYREQRSCAEFWIGFAAGRGIEVNVYGESMLLSLVPHDGLYGYDW